MSEEAKAEEKLKSKYGSLPMQNPHMRRMQGEAKGRKYFDSADWAIQEGKDPVKDDAPKAGVGAEGAAAIGGGSPGGSKLAPNPDLADAAEAPPPIR